MALPIGLLESTVVLMNLIRNMKETIAKINEVMASLQTKLAKAAEGNKAAAARARKATLELEKLGKEFRKQPIAELK